MQLLENIPYNKLFLIDDNYYFDGYIERIYLEKTFLQSNSKDQYFLKLMKLTTSGNLESMGFLYFYVDFINNKSDFIGIYIKPEYRNNGLASLLVSNWIKLCLDNNIYNLSTNRKQRKPALIYLLKNYFFELENPEIYEESKYTIDICQGIYDKLKYLYFKNEDQKAKFLQSTIMCEGNYYVLDNMSNNYILLDNVLLSYPYYLQEENKAYTRSLKCIENKKCN